MTGPGVRVEVLPVLFRRPLDRHQTAFALGEALAHLHYLEARGELDRVPGEDGVDRFIRTSGIGNESGEEHVMRRLAAGGVVAPHWRCALLSLTAGARARPSRSRSALAWG